MRRIGRKQRFAVFCAAGILTMAAMLVLRGCKDKKPSETDLLDSAAKLPEGLPVSPLNWPAVTTIVDRAQGTMATLTANEPAARFLRGEQGGVGAYPAGSELALTTWGERDDPHWFGARIPGQFIRLELVAVKAGANGKTAISYRRFEGAPAREITGGSEDEARKSAILAMRAAQMP